MLRLFFLGRIDLLSEEAYYWNYAQHLDLSYLDHPPMVALLIKSTTSLFGTNEFTVRLSSLLCWSLTAFFSLKLTKLIDARAGLYTVMLLAILPFFFLHSLVITPDQPLIVCWSATLYYLYRALIQNESRCWYTAGMWCGLGLLSKYTIVLLGPTTLLYLIMIPTARHWLTRKEPYLAALIAMIVFTPVIYWNATHEWVSFIFQSSRRMQSPTLFSLHYFFGLLLFFAFPAGILGLWKLLKTSAPLASIAIGIETKRFLQLYTGIPLLFFGCVSLTHGIKFNWIGPPLLALIPWLALLITHEKKGCALTGRTSWTLTAFVLLSGYLTFLLIIVNGSPVFLYQKLFPKFIDWNNLTQQVYTIAHDLEATTHTQPIIVPLDSYSLSSEILFYQAKGIAQHTLATRYPVNGGHVFNHSSLMYRYWSNDKALIGKALIVISPNRNDFDDVTFKDKIVAASPVGMLWSHSPMVGSDVTPYYYEIVRLKPVL